MSNGNDTGLRNLCGTSACQGMHATAVSSASAISQLQSALTAVTRLLPWPRPCMAAALQAMRVDHSACNCADQSTDYKPKPINYGIPTQSPAS